jgi:uroporphyrinogen decarboxylase
MIQTIGERGLLRVHLANGVGMTLMTTAMGMENAMTAFYDDRPTFDAMLNVCAEYCQKVIKRMLELGAPWIFVSWHDLGVSAGWSPTIWRNAFRTVIKASIDLVHEHGALYHYFDNGPIMPILAEVGELGPDSISSLCPPPVGDADLAEAKRLIGAKVCLIGNVDAIHVMQKGGPAEVRAAVLDAIEAGAPGGGFILGNSDAFFQGTPRENIDAFFAAAREFGRYDA